MPKSVLVVEDEQDIATLIEFHLRKEGFEVEVARTGRAGLEAAQRSEPDLLILDIMLPDLDGLEVCRRLKRHDTARNIPIIMVSARGEEADIVSGLELGADDYVTKPFSPRVLMARVRATLRRGIDELNGHAPDDADSVTLPGGVVIDTARHIVRVEGERVDLTATQFRLLAYLAERPGFVRTRDQIVSAVRGEDAVLSSRAVDVHVAALRQKLGDRGRVIETVRGVGYRIADELVDAPV
ncbi:MAG: response regulator transcription factor [Phycisphaerales bacterium]|nr:response regulator transcription factor [Phycisphaerales bacterium]